MRRAGKRGGGVAVGLAKLDEQIGRLAAMRERRARTQRRAAIANRRQHLVVDLDQRGRVLGDGPRPRDDDGDRLADEHDLVLGEDEGRNVGRQLLGAELQRQPLVRQQRRKVGET